MSTNANHNHHTTLQPNDIDTKQYIKLDAADSMYSNVFSTQKSVSINYEGYKIFLFTVFITFTSSPLI